MSLHPTALVSPGARLGAGGARAVMLAIKQDVVAVAVKDGKELWRHEEPKLNQAYGWSTPFVWQNERRTEIIADSAGPGRWRGGVGIATETELGPSAKTNLAYTCDRERSIVRGIFGGLPGFPHRKPRDKRTGRLERVVRPHRYSGPCG